ncbi:MAG: recombinase family protein [Candidatus Zixiibacteriota bacterium]
MNLALLYTRVSSKEQEKEGYSLDAQEKLGCEYALRKNLNITRSWKVSESAWKQERTAFNQMIEYAKKHDEVKHIIFDVTDRMTRNDFDKLKIYTLIKEYNKTIHFSRTNKVFDKNSGPDDEFMFDIEVAVAKKMSNDISRKTQMGMLEKAEQGLYPGPAPLGYRNNKFNHLIDIEEESAPFVKRAFSLMATGLYSLSMARDKLYGEGLRSKQGFFAWVRVQSPKCSGIPCTTEHSGGKGGYTKEAIFLSFQRNCLTKPKKFWMGSITLQYREKTLPSTTLLSVESVIAK